MHTSTKTRVVHTPANTFTENNVLVKMMMVAKTNTIQEE